MNYRVLVTFDQTEAFDKALMAGFEVIGTYPSTGATGIVGQPAPSTVLVLRAPQQPAWRESELHDTRRSGTPPDDFFRNYP